MGTKKEIWREVPGFTGCFVSNFGRVHNKRRNGKLSLGTVSNRGGYTKVTWVNDFGEKRNLQVHQVVALAFPDLVPNPGGKTQIDHLDGNPQNNSASNLRWVTAKENSDNLVRMRRTNGTSVFKKRIVRCDGYEVDNGQKLLFKTITEAAHFFGCSTNTISRILEGEQKANGYGIHTVRRFFNDSRLNF